MSAAAHRLSKILRTGRLFEAASSGFSHHHRHLEVGSALSRPCVTDRRSRTHAVPRTARTRGSRPRRLSRPRSHFSFQKHNVETSKRGRQMWRLPTRPQINQQFQLRLCTRTVTFYHHHPHLSWSVFSFLAQDLGSSRAFLLVVRPSMEIPEWVRRIGKRRSARRGAESHADADADARTQWFEERRDARATEASTAVRASRLRVVRISDRLKTGTGKL